jgi:hypothetical protein
MTQEWEAEVVVKVLLGRDPNGWRLSVSNASASGLPLLKYVQMRMDVYREAKKAGVLRVR